MVTETEKILISVIALGNSKKVYFSTSGIRQLKVAGLLVTLVPQSTVSFVLINVFADLFHCLAWAIAPNGCFI